MINGIINVYKEPGYTSFDVVAKLRGILKQRKIGHTGTLDPMAEGVLIVCLGNATKLVDMITSGDKSYKATMLLGKTTDTEDITGKILSEKTVDVTEEKVCSVVKSFVCEYPQIPPMYSAIKKDGKKLYEYARAGKVIEREPRPVKIYSIEDIKVDLPKVQFTVNCSKGTYIRSLCRDIGDKLETGGTLTALKRDNVHGFSSENALTLSMIEELCKQNKIMEYVLPTDSLLNNYPKYILNEEYRKYLYNGNKLYANQFTEICDYETEDIIRVYDDDRFVALYKKNDLKNTYKPYKMFLEQE